VIVVTHRNNLLSLADKVLLLVDGQIGGFGSPEEILGKVAKRQAA
jgi:ABC-type protease/lipase transport system fused ATPase/permease subunit